jgi:mRNA-degrading endonuclease toxin of MazEF toxin-antitoxin module
MNADSTLRRVIESAKDEHGLPLKDFTVLGTRRDPYRVDTPAGHRVGKWLADNLHELHDGSYRLHLRGLHYKLVGNATKLDGSPYINDDMTWKWMSEYAAKCARFLGYISWSEIRDARNSPPQVFRSDFTEPRWFLSTPGVRLELPNNIEPVLVLGGNIYRQPYQLIVIAEKAGVGPLLLPICQRRQATLCLPGGELSDQMLHDMLEDAWLDGRPVVIFQLGDFDPGGWQMAISTARTAQALVDTEFPGLRVIVHHVALNRAQCEEWGLPTSPLKDSEKRGTAWKARWGREQTELDSAVVLQPDAFTETMDAALCQYFDKGLANRAVEVRGKLEAEANARLADTIGAETLAMIRTEAENALEALEEQVQEINDRLEIDPTEVGLEMPKVPEVMIGSTRVVNDPLLDTDEDWAEQTRRLVAQKAYDTDD